MDKDPQAALEVLKEYAESMGNELSGSEAHLVLSQVDEAVDILAGALGLGPKEGRLAIDVRFEGRRLPLADIEFTIHRINRWYIGAQDDLHRGTDDAEKSYFLGVAQTLRAVLEILHGLPVTEATVERNVKGQW